MGLLCRVEPATDTEANAIKGILNHLALIIVERFSQAFVPQPTSCLFELCQLLSQSKFIDESLRQTIAKWGMREGQEKLIAKWERSMSQKIHDFAMPMTEIHDETTSYFDTLQEALSTFADKLYDLSGPSDLTEFDLAKLPFNRNALRSLCQDLEHKKISAEQIQITNEMLAQLSELGSSAQFKKSFAKHICPKITLLTYLFSSVNSAEKFQKIDHYFAHQSYQALIHYKSTSAPFTTRPSEILSPTPSSQFEM